jgi:magnesium chelatase subunit D
VDETLELSDRVKATEVSSQWKDDWRAVLRECADEEEQLRLDVVLARARLANGTVAVPHSAIEYLVERAMKGRCRGHRAEICAAKFARAAAALRGGSRVEKQDLLVAVELAIRPRDTVEVEDDLGDDDEEMPNQDEAAEEDPEEFAETGTGETEAETDDTDDTTDDDTDETPDESPDEPPPTLSPDQLVFKPDESALAAFAAELLSAFEKSAKKRRRHETGGSPANRSKSKNKTKSLERGRYVKAEFPKGGVVRKIAIDATLRAASVHQLQRRKNRGVSKSSKRIFITKDDLRNKRMSRKSSSLTVFLVDASGSMALHRFDVAKGAALLLLASSFSKRDQIAVVSYGGDFARVVLPPSRSLRLAKTRLSELPSGGGTPLAHGLVTAGRVAYASSKFKQNVGSAKVVLLTDGGCNVTLERSNEAERFSTVTTPKSYTPISSEIPSKAFLRNQAVAVAGTLGKRGVRVFVVDCSRRFAVENFAPSSGIEPTTKDPQEALPKQLAQAARGSYYRLAPNLDAKRAGETLAGVLDA